MVEARKGPLTRLQDARSDTESRSCNFPWRKTCKLETLSTWPRSSTFRWRQVVQSNLSSSPQVGHQACCSQLKAWLAPKQVRALIAALSLWSRICWSLPRSSSSDPYIEKFQGECMCIHVCNRDSKDNFSHQETRIRLLWN